MKLVPLTWFGNVNCNMWYVVGRAPAIISASVGGIHLHDPAVEGMIFHGVPLLPQESPNVQRSRPLFSVANLTT